MAIWTRASCGQKVFSRMNSVSIPTQAGSCCRCARSASAVSIQRVTQVSSVNAGFAGSGDNSLPSFANRLPGPT